jgi:hypothetical protein
MKKVADGVFLEWTENLESCGSLKMRQQSQNRLERTRARYEAVESAVVAALLTYDAFNGDLNDHALFLEHDFNSASIAMVAGEVDGLVFRSQELDRRLDACGAAARAYVEASALHGQLEEPAAGPEAQAAPPAAQAQAAPAAPAAAAPAPAQQPPAPRKPRTQLPKPTAGSKPATPPAEQPADKP